MNGLKTVDVARFRTMFPDMHDMEFGKEFFLGDVRYGQNGRSINGPFRMDGVVGVICIEGELDIDLNLKSVHLVPGKVLIYIPGNIMQIRNCIDGARCIVMALSTDYVANLHLDMKKIFNDSMRLLESPCFEMTTEEMEVCAGYARLAQRLVENDLISEKREALGSLISSLYYAIGSSWKMRISKARLETGRKQSQRGKIIFEQFSHLAKEYHAEHRDLDFYADKLCITPKHLSRVIKLESGMTAPELIDAFVIMEAKHLLRFSDLSIKEIAEHLHFGGNAVFYTFFKNRTGYSPMKYRNMDPASGQ